MHRISDVRMSGSAIRSFNMFRKFCGDEALKNVAIVTNMWGEVSLERGIAREQELASDDGFFKPVLQDARMMRHQTNSRRSAHHILEFFLDKRPQPLLIQRELVEEKKDIMETSAGMELDREVAEAQRKYKEEMEEIQKEMEEALRMKDEETRKELEEAFRQLESEMKKAQNDRLRLSREYAEDKRKKDEEVRRILREYAEDKRRMDDEVRRIPREYQTEGTANNYSRLNLIAYIGTGIYAIISSLFATQERRRSVSQQSEGRMRITRPPPSSSFRLVLSVCNDALSR